jgi:hypothetical protein
VSEQRGHRRLRSGQKAFQAHEYPLAIRTGLWPRFQSRVPDPRLRPLGAILGRSGGTDVDQSMASGSFPVVRPACGVPAAMMITDPFSTGYSCPSMLNTLVPDRT